VVVAQRKVDGADPRAGEELDPLAPRAADVLEEACVACAVAGDELDVVVEVGAVKRH
jgi:hypothetical protein